MTNSAVVHDGEKKRLEVGYPPGYGILPVEEQIDALAALLQLKREKTASVRKVARELPEIPSGAEGWFAVVHDPDLVINQFGSDDKEMRHFYGVVCITSKIGISRHTFSDSSHMVATHFKRSQTEYRALAVLADRQKAYDGILIIPAQFGARWAGRSAKDVRKVLRHVTEEFALGTFIISSMILTHPKRFSETNQLFVVCAGDSLAPHSPGKPRIEEYTEAPVFDWSDLRSKTSYGQRMLELSRRSRIETNPLYGAPTAFMWG